MAKCIWSLALRCETAMLVMCCYRVLLFWLRFETMQMLCLYWYWYATCTTSSDMQVGTDSRVA